MTPQSLKISESSFGVSKNKTIRLKDIREITYTKKETTKEILIRTFGKNENIKHSLTTIEYEWLTTFLRNIIVTTCES